MKTEAELNREFWIGFREPLKPWYSDPANNYIYDNFGGSACCDPYHRGED